LLENQSLIRKDMSKPVGYYKKDGKTRPITQSTHKQVFHASAREQMILPPGIANDGDGAASIGPMPTTTPTPAPATPAAPVAPMTTPQTIAPEELPGSTVRPDVVAAISFAERGDPDATTGMLQTIPTTVGSRIIPIRDPNGTWWLAWGPVDMTEAEILTAFQEKVLNAPQEEEEMTEETPSFWGSASSIWG
jgi:hypothetical protein